MIPAATSWRACGIGEIQSHLGDFTDWALCGGHSIDLLAGRKTRDHGDIDIGVFRSRLLDCLAMIARERVFLCTKDGHVRWTGGEVDDSVRDIWISDPSIDHWIFQIMVYDDDDGIVSYRRDRRITWLKTAHYIQVDSLRILNPAITFLYKSNKGVMMDKEAADVATLIAYFAARDAGSAGGEDNEDSVPGKAPPR